MSAYFESIRRREQSLPPRVTTALPAGPHPVSVPTAVPAQASTEAVAASVASIVPAVGSAPTAVPAPESVRMARPVVRQGAVANQPAFEALREQLATRGNGQAVHAVVFVGCNDTDSCSGFVRAFAYSLAESGSRVLTVDTAAVADGQPIGDLASAMRSAAAVPTQPFSIGRIATLTMGELHGEKEALLRSSSFSAWLEAQRAVFDYVLFAAPPVLRFADATLLGRVADGVVLLVQAEGTERASLSRARAQLDRAGVNILGAVLDGVRTELSPTIRRYLGDP